MKGIQKKRAADLEKPFPGCMGRMINLFDFGPGMTGNKLLTDKEHQNGDFLCIPKFPLLPSPTRGHFNP